MGLLLGCSVITLFEVMDLIFYNLSLKAHDQRQKLKSPRSIRKKALPPFQYNF